MIEEFINSQVELLIKGIVADTFISVNAANLVLVFGTGLVVVYHPQPKGCILLSQHSKIKEDIFDDFINSDNLETLFRIEWSKHQERITAAELGI